MTPSPDLRRVILDASIVLLEEKGLGALSMREVARRAGVSHQAPYHHFADREAILAELAREGFDDLHARLAAAATGASALRARLLAQSHAYVGFALERPAHFRVMFRPELVDLSRFPACEAAGDSAFAALGRIVADLVPAPSAAPGELESWGTFVWSTVHGLACLVLDGPLCRKLPEGTPVAFVVDATLERFVDAVLAAAPAARGEPSDGGRGIAS